jgi:hypothetical protein
MVNKKNIDNINNILYNNIIFFKDIIYFIEKGIEVIPIIKAFYCLNI